jgi:acetyltransferase-like isoleucine patch superfamily enzyme
MGIGRLLSRAWKALSGGRPADWREKNRLHIEKLRARGVRIGQGCFIFTDEFSTEPYLVEIGDRVAISGGTTFLTHDGAAFLLRQRRPNAQHLGRIVVGNDVAIGQNCTILAGTRIGSSCVIGAGSVVRGTIPDGMVVMGNPCQVVGRTSLYLEMMDVNPDTIDTFSMKPEEREAAIRRHFAAP